MTGLLDARFGSYSLPDMPNRLTPRQHQLVALLVDRHTVAEAARALGISIHTARAHVRSIANRVPNPHGLPAHRLIVSYFNGLSPTR